MSDNNTGYNPTAEQQQNMDNLSFDRKYLVNGVEILTENEAGTEIVRQKPLATSSNQTDGSQKTQIVDISGNTVVPTTPTDIQLAELIPVLRSLILAIANPAYVDKSANQMRAQVTGSLTTVTNLTTLTNFGTFPADHLQRMDNMTAWATNIRSLIT